MKLLILGNQSRAVANFWSVLARHALKAGHTVIFAIPPGDATAEERLLSIVHEGSNPPKIVHYPLSRKGLNPIHDAQTFWALRRLFQQEKPDWIFTSTIKPVIYGCLAARSLGLAHVYATITGLGYAFEANTFFKKCINKLSIFLYRQALTQVDGVFFQNNDDAQLFRSCGITTPKTRVLMARGTGVDTVFFAKTPLPPLPSATTPPEQRSLTFLLIARLLEAKGIPEYASAAHRLKKRYPQARFQLLGPAEQGLGSVSTETIAQWQREGGIEYLGETRDVRPYVAAAHVLVLPSWREGIPTSIMEGMSMGRPALVTDVPGCRDVVQHQQNGLICQAHKASALEEALRFFLDHPEHIPSMAEASYQRAKTEFDADIVAQGILRDMRFPL